MNDLIDVNNNFLSIRSYVMANQYTSLDSDKKILAYRKNGDERDYVKNQFNDVKRFRDVADVLNFMKAKSMEELEEIGIYIQRMD
jgi:hypothetical protein